MSRLPPPAQDPVLPTQPPVDDLESVTAKEFKARVAPDGTRYCIACDKQLPPGKAVTCAFHRRARDSHIKARSRLRGRLLKVPERDLSALLKAVDHLESEVAVAVTRHFERGQHEWANEMMYAAKDLVRKAATLEKSLGQDYQRPPPSEQAPDS